MEQKAFLSVSVRPMLGQRDSRREPKIFEVLISILFLKRKITEEKNV